MVIGAVSGFMLATPEKYSITNSVPGVGLNRQCPSSGFSANEICNSIRDREMYSGSGWTTNTYTDNQKTLEKQIMFSGIGGLGTGLIVFSLTLINSKTFSTNSSTSILKQTFILISLTIVSIFIIWFIGYAIMNNHLFVKYSDLFILYREDKNWIYFQTEKTGFIILCSLHGRPLVLSEEEPACDRKE